MTNAELEEAIRQLSNRIAEIERVMALQNENLGECVEYVEKDKVDKAKGDPT